MKAEDLGSDFNYAISYLQTIREIENQCLACAIQDNYIGWLKSIKALYRELHRRMVTEERNHTENLIKRAEQLVYRTSTLSGIDKNKENSLINTEIYLKDIIRKRGMDLPVKERAGEALSGDKGY